MIDPSATPVSIILPAYNAERYLPHALDSVLAQTHTHFELIVVDDGSKDGTLDLAYGYQARDPRVRVFTQRNGGIARALNRAAREARYKWLARMDADDLMVPNRLERQLAFLAENPELSVASSLVYYIDEKGDFIGEGRSPFTNRRTVAAYVRKNRLIAINHPGAIIRKSALLDVGGYRAEFVPVEDIDLWNRLVDAGYQLLVQPEFLLHYRVHSQSTVGRRVAENERMGQWARHCMIQRRQGRPEVDFKVFQEQLDAAPWWSRLNRARIEYGLTMYGRAVFSIAAGAYLGAAAQLLSAAVLRPALVADRVWPRLAGRRLRSGALRSREAIRDAGGLRR